MGRGLQLVPGQPEDVVGTRDGLRPDQPPPDLADHAAERRPAEADVGERVLAHRLVALGPWHEPREPPPAQALHARKQRPRGLLTCPSRRGLPLVGVTRLTLEEVLERFEQRGRLVGGDTLGEIEVIDGMAESVEVLGEPAAELAPGLRVGHGRGRRLIRRDNLGAPRTSRDSRPARVASAPTSPGHTATSPPGSAPVEAEQEGQRGRVVLAPGETVVREREQGLGPGREGQDAALDGYVMLRRHPRDLAGAVEQLRGGGRAQVARGPGIDDGDVSRPRVVRPARDRPPAQPAARAEEPPRQVDDHSPRADLTIIVIGIIVDGQQVLVGEHAREPEGPHQLAIPLVPEREGQCGEQGGERVWQQLDDAAAPVFSLRAGQGPFERRARLGQHGDRAAPAG